MKTLKNIALQGLLTLGILFSSCINQDKKEEQAAESAPLSTIVVDTITLSGAYALNSLMKNWVTAFNDVYPNVFIQISNEDAVEAMDKASRNELDLVMISSEEQIDPQMWKMPLARTGVVLMYNVQNPYAAQIQQIGLTKEKLKAIFTAEEPPAWGDYFGEAGETEMSVFRREDNAGAHRTLVKFLGIEEGTMQGQMKEGEQEMCMGIRDNILAIGYCNLSTVYDLGKLELRSHVGIMPCDLNANGRIDAKEEIPTDYEEIIRTFCLGKYPTDLCRVLFVVAPVAPVDPVVNAFLDFCLGEGQNAIDSLAYARLRPS
jgi:phosphate transport system substrate-binding protein